MKKKHTSNSFFVRSLLTNVLVCSLVIALIVPLCINFYNSFYDRQRDNLQNSLQVMLDDLSSNLNSLGDMLGAEKKNEPLIKLSIISGSVPASASWNILKAQNYISTIALNPYVADCVAAYAKNDLLITKNAVFYGLSDFLKFYSIEGEDYYSFFTSVGSLDNYSHFLKATQIRTSPFVSNSGSSYQPVEEVLTGTPLAFCYYMPLSVQYDYGGCFLFIKESSLLDKLPQEFLEKGSFSLSDKNGNCIYTYRAEMMDAAGGIPLTHLTTPGGTLTLSATIDEGLLPGLLVDTQRLIYFYILAAIVFVLCLSIYFTRRQYRPIRTILAQLQGYGYTLPQEADQLAFVEHAITDMQNTQKNIMETLSTYHSQLQANQLERLLSGHSVSTSLPDILLHPYRVAYAYVEDVNTNQDYSLLGTLITEQLSSRLPSSVVVHQLENTSFVLILPADYAPDMLQEIANRINSQLPQSLCIALSREISGADRLHAAFEAVRTASLAADTPHIFQLAEHDFPSNSISLHICLKLHQELLSGNSDQAKKILDDILNNAFLPFENLADAYSYCRLIMRFAIRDAQLDIALSPPPCTTAFSPEIMHGKLADSAEKICQAQRDQRKMRETARDEEVLRYIQENLDQPELSAESIAQHFGLSERAIKRIVRLGGRDVSFSVFFAESADGADLPAAHRNPSAHQRGVPAGGLRHPQCFLQGF